MRGGWVSGGANSLSAASALVVRADDDAFTPIRRDTSTISNAEHSAAGYGSGTTPVERDRICPLRKTT
jgi:hypothetical protein